MVARVKRSRIDLFATILEVIRRYPEGVRIARMSYGVGMPVDRLKEMVEEVCTNGLVAKTGEDESFYQICRGGWSS